jgi:hypothetical protein
MKLQKCLFNIAAAYFVSSCSTAPQTHGSSKDDEVMAKAVPFAAGLDEMRPNDRIATAKSFLIYKNSKIYTKTIVDPALKAHPAMNFYGTSDWDKDRAGRLASGFGRVEELASRVDANGVSLSENQNGLNEGKNIRITLFFGVNQRDLPYVIKITIRQGNVFWSKTIDRDGAQNWSPIGTVSNAMGPHHNLMGNVFGYDQMDLSEIVSEKFCLAEKCQ